MKAERAKVATLSDELEQSRLELEQEREKFKTKEATAKETLLILKRETDAELAMLQVSTSMMKSRQP